MTRPRDESYGDDLPTLGPDEPVADVSSFHDMPTSAGPPGASLPPMGVFGGVFAAVTEGTSVPGYTIKQPLGEGGMGAVYLAEQERPRRTVALKMIRPDRVNAATLKRFDYEAQLLASLRHPGIAAVYEVGRFDLGGMSVPYFAMEYIPGARTLTAYASTAGLNTGARLELFLKVCDAVQHGHQRGVIHRDLKPANILVDNTGAPRIIDFGVARGSDADRAQMTMQTDAGQIVGTLQYMAPEQCSTDGAADMRSDVYALGAVLFELLTGRVPYDVRTLGLADAIKVITEIPPPPLSTMSAGLRGDLTVIVAKALEKSKSDRYQSVSEFAGDVRRYLNDQPILARPVGPIGLLRKWVKRNRELAVALGAAALLLLATSSVLIGRIIAAERRATQNLELAEQNLEASRESVELVREMLNFRAPDGESRVREGMVDVEVLLDDAAASITQNPPALAGTEAAFRELLGVGYISLRSIDKAKAQLARVLDVRRATSPNPSAELAEALHSLARAHYWAGEFEKAHELYAEALAMRRALKPGDDPETAMSLTHLAATEQRLGRLEDAERLFTEALQMRQRLYGNEHADIAASLNNLGNLLLAAGDIDGAEFRLRQSLEMISRLVNPTSLEISNAANNLARVVLRQGRAEEAADLFRNAVTIREARLKPGDERVQSSRLGLADALLSELLNKGLGPDLENSRERLRENGPPRAEALGVLAERLAEQRRWHDAACVLDAALTTVRPFASGHEALVARLLADRAAAAAALGDYEDAEGMLAEAKAMLPPDGDSARHNAAVGVLLDRLRESGRDSDAARCVALVAN
jgi:tetratricopeptide (TPR) repeat protein